MTRPAVARLTCLVLIVVSSLIGCGSRDQPGNTGDQPSNSATPKQAQRVEPVAEPSQEPVSQEDDPIQVAETRRQDDLAMANQLSEQGRFNEAASLLKRLLVADPQDAEVIFVLANLAAVQGDMSSAVELLDGIPADHPEAGIPALGQSADWCVELQRYDEAERRYREVLKLAPGAFPARRQLAFLLNCQGRREEAASQIRELCMIGNVRQDELHSLIMLSHAMFDDPSQATDREQVSGQAGNSSDVILYTPIDPGGTARKLFTDGKFTQAADALQDVVEDGSAPPSLMALYGRAVVEAQDDDRFLIWLGKTDDRTRELADYWAAVGTYLISQRRFEEATRALLEAALRDPTDMNSFGRLGQTMLTLGDKAASQRWLDRWDDMNELVKANNRVSETIPPDPDRIAELVGRLEKLNRPLEAVLWRSIAAHYRGSDTAGMASENQLLRQLVSDGTAFSNSDQRLCGLDRTQFRLPELSELTPGVAKRTASPSGQSRSVSPARFENVADEAGVSHSFQVAAEPQSDGFAIYQTYGGAVAATDFDLDGRCDLYFAQGGSDPPTFEGRWSNQLYRSVEPSSLILTAADGDKRETPHTKLRMVDVTAASEATERRYTLGVTAGDWNQDGFDDLIVANLGEDSLLINNGDGTFTRSPIIAPNDQNRVPTSLALGDLDGDSLPDILELSYVDDPRMILLPTRNEAGEVIKAMSPMQYDPGPDRICINDGRGGMSIKSFNTDASDYRTGLGVVVTDFNNQPGNEIFVGNDLYPDQLWVRNRESGSWADVAPMLGCAFGIRGSKTASMGIGVGDLDNSGTLDIHITNYQNRNASLFLNLGESFLERNVQYGLAGPSQAVLGFGTQTLDFDNDGLLDMVATNGHIERAITIDEPFEQPPQLFANQAGRFELTAVEDPSGYWKSKHLGRGLARADLDRDGRSDVVITHLGEASAVILNGTENDNHWLQIRLVGVESERDAVGAKVSVEFGEGRLTSWVTAGDGYLARNEPIVSFGLGSYSDVVSVEVVWPSGAVETFDEVEVNQRVLIIEGNEAVHAFASPTVGT